MATPAKFQLPICDHKPAPYTGPSREETLALRQQYLTPGLVTYYKEPLMIVEGHMQYVWDEKGRQYLDAYAGVVTISVGHCHPHVVEKVREQVGKLQHITTLYVHPTIGQFGKKLIEHFPSNHKFSAVYFTNSGSEANEIAILSAREFTGNQEVISLRNCYHGGTSATMGLTAHSTWKFRANPTINVKNALVPYCYRCPYGLEYPSCGVKCAHDVENVIKYETSGQVAAFISEPIQGVGGVVTPPPEYLSIVYDIVRKYGGLCIADEVQAGFGRTGTKFWGHENWNVTPDIVTMAKGIGNGAPLAACVTRKDIGEMMKRRVHFNTYAGNPISMTQGLATVEVIDNEGIQQKAHDVGGYLKGKLTELQEKHKLIGEVRGMGLMLGAELVKDRKTKEPANAEANDIMEMCKDRGLIIGKGGLFGNTLRIKPPMCITKPDVDFLIETLDGVLTEIEGRK